MAILELYFSSSLMQNEPFGFGNYIKANLWSRLLKEIMNKSLWE